MGKIVWIPSYCHRAAAPVSTDVKPKGKTRYGDYGYYPGYYNGYYPGYYNRYYPGYYPGLYSYIEQRYPYV